MALIEISNTFLVAVIVCYIVFRLVCEFRRETHLRPQRPSEIDFTTSVVPSYMMSSNGARIALSRFIDDLILHGDMLATTIEPIRIYYETADRQWRSLDNERLYALRKAEECGAVSAVRYTVVDPSSGAYYESKYSQAYKKNVSIPTIEETPGFEWNSAYNLGQ